LTTCTDTVELKIKTAHSQVNIAEPSSYKAENYCQVEKVATVLLYQLLVMSNIKKTESGVCFVKKARPVVFTDSENLNAGYKYIIYNPRQRRKAPSQSSIIQLETLDAAAAPSRVLSTT
jgi:hypothetical protein